MRPNARLASIVADTRAKRLIRTNTSGSVHLPRHFLGLQIRHSTTWIHGRVNVPLSQFMEKVAEMRIPDQVIFVSTEDPDVINQLSSFSNATFYFTDIERTNENQARAIAKGRLDGEKDGLNALINLFIMRDARWFVGGFRSNWGRLVLEHMLGIGNPPAITIALDQDKGKREWTAYSALKPLYSN